MRLKELFRSPANLITFLAIVQVLSATYFLNIEGFHAINSILFLLCGVGISLLLLHLPSLQIPKATWINKQSIPKLLIFIILIPLSYQYARQIMDATPLQKEYADMLPVMKVMGTRFLNGHWQQVYTPIPEIWNGIRPIYLPAMWLPFTPALLLHFDMRWITVCGIWLSLLLSMGALKWKASVTHILFGLSILVLLAWLHFDEVNNVIRLTEEGVVFFYYSLMVAALIAGNGWLIGIAAALCFLSRYAIIGWIPFAGLYLVFTQQYKLLTKIVIAGAATVLLLLVIPFGWKPLLYHLQLPAEYIGHASRVWNENPEYFTQSLGMAKFFGPGHVHLLHSVLVYGTFMIPILFGIYLRKKKTATTIALLSCFQLCITFFYNFIDVSYLYLFYTPVFVSLAIASWTLLANRKSPSI